MTDETYKSYENYLNIRIKKFKENGLKALTSSPDHAGTNLVVSTLKSTSNIEINFAYWDRDGTLRNGPQSAAVSLKSQYNYFKKLKPNISDVEIMNQAVGAIFNHVRSCYKMTIESTETYLPPDSAVSYYYSAKVLLDFIRERSKNLRELEIEKEVQNFLSSEVNFVGELKERSKIWWKRMSGEGSVLTKSQTDTATFLGGALAIGIVLIIVVGFFKIVSGGASSSLYSGSGYSSQSSGGSMTINGESYTQQQFEDKLRGEAERLYDNCQAFGSGFSDKCP